MLDGIPLFSGLSDAEKSTVALFSQERKIYAGDVLIREGDDATAMYVVITGKLKTYRERSTGEVLLGYVYSGGLVGEMAIFDHSAPKVRQASVMAVEDSLLLVIVDYAIMELSRKHPEVFEKISKVIYMRNAENMAKRHSDL
jgi:CRP-like cAMP-binding protein